MNHGNDGVCLLKAALMNRVNDGVCPLHAYWTTNDGGGADGVGGASLLNAFHASLTMSHQLNAFCSHEPAVQPQFLVVFHHRSCCCCCHCLRIAGT